MLALSTFRQSQRAVELAIEKARKPGELVIVYVVDVNLARYLMDTDIGFYSKLMKTTEEELLGEHKATAEKRVATIAREAETRGITVRASIVVGRFAQECIAVVDKEQPELIVTTRSDRPAWARRFFGSPVDRLIRHAGCPVREA